MTKAYCPLLKTVDLLESNQDLKNLFSYNQFSEDIEFLRWPVWDPSIEAGKTLDDQDITQIRYYMSSIYKFEPPNNIIWWLLVVDRSKVVGPEGLEPPTNGL